MYLHFFIFFCYQVLGVGGEEGCCTVKVFHVRCSAVNFGNEQYSILLDTPIIKMWLFVLHGRYGKGWS